MKVRKTFGALKKMCDVRSEGSGVRESYERVVLPTTTYGAVSRGMRRGDTTRCYGWLCADCSVCMDGVRNEEISCWDCVTMKMSLRMDR